MSDDQKREWLNWLYERQREINTLHSNIHQMMMKLDSPDDARWMNLYHANQQIHQAGTYLEVQLDAVQKELGII